MAISRFLVRDTRSPSHRRRRIAYASAGVLLYDPHKSVCRALSVTKGRTEARKETRKLVASKYPRTQTRTRVHTHVHTLNGKQCVSARACRVFFLLSWPRPSFSTRVSPLQPLFSPLAHAHSLATRREDDVCFVNQRTRLKVASIAARPSSRRNGSWLGKPEDLPTSACTRNGNAS